MFGRLKKRYTTLADTSLSTRLSKVEVSALTSTAGTKYPFPFGTLASYAVLEVVTLVDWLVSTAGVVDEVFLRVFPLERESFSKKTTEKLANATMVMIKITPMVEIALL